jgi:cytokinin dehydrogenase
MFDWNRDDATIGWAATDFGGLVEHRPAAVVRPRCVDDVVQAVRHAHRTRIPLSARGQGHSTRGQAQALDGLVLDMSGLHGLRVEQGAIVAEAGARWDAVFRHALARGLTPPVLTDYLGLSVAGTLSVGGVGGQSFRHGTQTDLVDQLTVVTGRGDVVTCSPDRQPDLFDACLGGLGQCAIILEARLRLVPAPAEAHIHHVAYPSVALLLQDQERLAQGGRVDYLLGSALPDAGGWRFELELGIYAQAGQAVDDRAVLAELQVDTRSARAETMPYAAHACRLERLEVALKAAPAARHPWMDLFVPSASAPGLIGEALDDLEPADLQDGHLMTYSVSSAAGATPLLRIPGDPHGFLFDILPTVEPGNPAKLSRLEGSLRRIFQRSQQLGARVYPIGFPVGTELMTEAAWRAHFGAQWPKLRAAKETYDPHTILTPGPSIFSPRPVREQPQPDREEVRK